MNALGGKYVQLLQGMPDSNNGTTAGGLGSILQRALMGYAMGQEQEQQKAQQGRLTQALQALTGTPDNTITWNQPTRPDGTGDPTTTIPGQDPNRGLAIQLLAGDPSTAGMAFEMANQDYALQNQQGKPTTANQVGTFLDAQGNRVFGTYDDALANGWTQPPEAATDKTPATVAEWQYFNSLSPEDQQRFLAMKRSTQYLDLGNQFVAPDPLNPGSNITTRSVGIAPSREVIGNQIVTLPGVSGGNNPAPVNQTPPMEPGGLSNPPAQGSPTANPQGGVATQTIPGLPANLTPAQEAIDTAFAKDVYAPLIASGGAADAQKNVQQLEGVLSELQAIASGQSANNASGTAIGAMPDIIGNVLAPGAVDMRQQVEEVVQRNLRLILGPQFTEEEGKRLIERAYNPSLDESVNAARLSRLVGAMKSALDARMAAAQYYEQNGTLAGFQGTAQFTLNDFLGAIDEAPPPATGGGGDDALINKYLGGQ